MVNKLKCWDWIVINTTVAIAKSLQLCLTLCDPIDGSPPGFPIPGILQARTLEWVAISFSNAWKWKVKVKSLSRVRLWDPMDCSLPGSSIHGIFQASIVEWGCHCLLQSMIEALNIYLLDLLVTFNCIFLIDTHFSCVPRNYSPGIPSFFLLPSQLLWPNKSFYTISQGWSF